MQDHTKHGTTRHAISAPHLADDGLPICRGDDCTGYTVAHMQGLIPCERHADRRDAIAERPTCSCGKRVGERDMLAKYGKIGHGPECCTCPTGSRVHRATCPATSGQDEPQHTPACLAAAMICAVQNVRDDETSNLATADLYGIGLGYLVDELTACRCDVQAAR